MQAYKAESFGCCWLFESHVKFGGLLAWWNVETAEIFSAWKYIWNNLGVCWVPYLLGMYTDKHTYLCFGFAGLFACVTDNKKIFWGLVVFTLMK